MVTCGEVCKYLDSLAQPSLAEEWDNVGLLVGGAYDQVKRIMVCLDVTTRVVKEAIQKGVNLIISHHPVIFKPLNRIRKEEFKGRILYALFRTKLLFTVPTRIWMLPAAVSMIIWQVCSA